MHELKSVYEIQTCKSTIEAGDRSSEKLKEGIDVATVETKSGYAVCWLHDIVLIGRVEEGSLVFYNNQQPDYPRHLLRMRIFNADREYHVWRTGTVFGYRKRHDSEGDTADYVEAIQPLWGTQASAIENLPNWSRIFESRGTEIFIPFSGLSIDECKHCFSIVTRNYINSTGQAGYVDCRFVKFDFAGGEQ
jgi:CRISPR-associated protein (TIGR03984 family)